MNSNTYIQEFLNSNDPTHEIIVNAYRERDNLGNLNTRETREGHLLKLGYSLQKINEYRNRKQREFVTNYLERMYQDYESNSQNIQINFESIIEMYQNSNEYQIVENEVQNRISRFNILSNLLDTSNEQFYNALTVDELVYLGW